MKGWGQAGCQCRRRRWPPGGRRPGPPGQQGPARWGCPFGFRQHCLGGRFATLLAAHQEPVRDRGTLPRLRRSQTRGNVASRLSERSSYGFYQCPRQHSNLRSRLGRGWPCSLVVDALVTLPWRPSARAGPRPWHRPAPRTARIRRRHRTHTSSSGGNQADARWWMCHRPVGQLGAKEGASRCRQTRRIRNGTSRFPGYAVPLPQRHQPSPLTCAQVTTRMVRRLGSAGSGSCIPAARPLVR
jgi:hypothetical protein